MSGYPWSWTTTLVPERPAVSTASTKAAVLSALGEASSSPAARTAPAAFGPRAKIVAASSAAVSSAPSPAPSATSNQRRMP